MPQTPHEKELQKKLEPHIRKFVQEVDKLGLQTSALIFDPTGDFLNRCGNAPHEGKDLVRLHYFLSLVCVNLELLGHYEQSKSEDGPKPSNPEEIADKLVLSLLQAPSDLIPDRVLELATEYAEARRP
jgi:hypothetical protein